MNFDCVPYMTLAMRISIMQRAIIINSIRYYEMSNPLMPDRDFDIACKTLIDMYNKATNEELELTDYWYCMHDFDGTTGYDLYGRLQPEDKEKLYNIARSL